ncbi:GAK9 protein, partial [Emberiza fucata]|nr:GAK9 protein [Emberiza fucata]
MERQAAYDLFTAFLQTRQIKGIDLKKELPALLAYGYEKGMFQNPHTVHDLSEWHKFGDLLRGEVQYEDKVAKKMEKLWRVVHNELLQHQAEKRVAEQASEAQTKNKTYSGDWFQSTALVAPSTAQVVLPPPARCAFMPSAPPVPSALSPGSSIPARSATAPPPPGNEPLPGSECGRRGNIAKGRREAWATLAKDCLERGDNEAIEATKHLACPVIFNQQPGGGITATISTLDWKILSQLRATVSQYGVTSEPARQIRGLQLLWGSQLLLPADCRGIARLIFTQHQQLLFNAHWQALVNNCVTTQRQQGDPLYGVTVDELMGLGALLHTEAQAFLGADKVRKAMELAREAIDRVKEPGGIPVYMGIKQGQEESFGALIDKVASAIERAGVPLYMRGAMLKQCALQNCNQATRNMLSTLGSEWTIEEALERMTQVPMGPQAFLVQAIKELGVGLKEQAKASQNQVLAALAPLQASAAITPRSTAGGRLRCYRCGGM